MSQEILLITGVTGLVGSHIAEAACQAGLSIRALVRTLPPKAPWLNALGIEFVRGDMEDPESLVKALRGVDFVVHCAARVGDWGNREDYDRVNITALASFLDKAQRSDRLQRFIHISSLGVYAAKDHHGTDETGQVDLLGLDAYTRSKAISEKLTLAAVARGIPAIILRPGFVYGAHDRHVLPPLLHLLKKGRFLYVGDGEQILDQIYAKNVAHAVLLALKTDAIIGEIFNLTDLRRVSRKEFVETVVDLAGYSKPSLHLPRALALGLAKTMDFSGRLLKLSQPPLLSKARYKFLALNLDFSTMKAERLLKYSPAYDFQLGMAETMAWARAEGLV